MVWRRVWLLAVIAGGVALVLGGLVSSALGFGWAALGLPLGLLAAALVGVTARKGFDPRVVEGVPRPLRGPLARILGAGSRPAAR